MARVIVALAIMASINVVAIQLFISGNVGPLADFLPLQQATMITAVFIVMLDIMLVFWTITMKLPGQTSSQDFDRLFHKHYDGRNFNAAFEKARQEYKKALH